MFNFNVMIVWNLICVGDFKCFCNSVFMLGGNCDSVDIVIN